MEWNIKENFSMEWKIFSMEWKIASTEYELSSISFHALPNFLQNAHRIGLILRGT